MMLRPSVFVPQETMRRAGKDFVPVHDLSPALKFGELFVLLPPGPVSLDMGPILRTMRKKLAEFTDRDFIIATGDPAVISAAMLIAAAQNKGRVKMLRWDRNLGMYVSLQLDTHEGAKENGKRNESEGSNTEAADAIGNR